MPTLLLALRIASIWSGQQAAQTSYPSWVDLTDLLTQVRDQTKVPALGIGFIQGNLTQFAVVGEREIGKPDKAQIGDRWLIGSITKSMTATMIARLVDRGLMRWDTTIEQALPNTPMRPEYRQVTLLQLLQHRAGIQQDRYVTTEFLKEAAGESNDKVLCREHYTQFTLARDPLSKPGEKMAYSNAGYSIAAHMAEAMAHKPYERLMHDLLFRPLGMASVRMDVPGTPGNPGSPGQLNGHIFGDNGLEPHVIDDPKLNAIQESAGAGVSMCLADLLAFVRYHLEGLRGHVRLMSAKNFAVLHKPAIDSPGAYKYACGWVVDTSVTKEPYHGHNGSDGTFFAEIAIWPDRNLAAVAISNAASKKDPSPPLQAILAVYHRYAK